MFRYFAILQLHKDGRGKLDFIQNLEYKYIELISVEFETSSEEVIREAITFRYNSVKAKLIFLQNRMKDFSSLVKVKNPSLLIQMQKALNENGREAMNMSKSTVRSKNTSFFGKSKK